MPISVPLSDGTKNVLVDTKNVLVDRQPDQCPICHQKIAPLFRLSRVVEGFYKSSFQALCQCPNNACNEWFIAYFIKPDLKMTERYPAMMVGPEIYLFDRSRPQEISPPELPPYPAKISPSFHDIYIQAHAAEAYGLIEICGAGYRKSLEFLIKDYLINKTPDAREDIIKSQLGNCIKDRVDNPNIKEIAMRAAWLGNDETHYKRLWGNKDLNDLKTLIRLTLHWIEMEYLTAEAKISMPTKKA